MARDIRQKFTWVAATIAAPHDGDETGDSNPIVTGHMQDRAVQIMGTFDADVSIQVKLHPDFPYQEVANVSAAGITAITVPAESVKLVIQNYVSGTVQAVFAGFNVSPG